MSTAITHVRQIEVGWGDCDPAGIVFYPNFYRWFDACSHALLTSRGMSHRTLNERFGIIGCGLIDTGAHFTSPARFDDVLEAESRIGKLTNRTFTVEHVFRRGTVQICTGLEVRGCFVADDSISGGIKAIALPDELRAALQ